MLRFDGAVPEPAWRSFWRFIPVVVLLHLLSNFLFGLYGQMWRYASVQEARRVVLAGATAATLVGGAVTLVGGAERPIPLSVVALGACMSVFGFGAIRFQSRLFAVRRRTAGPHRKRVLLVGAGEAGAMVLRDIRRDPTLGLDPVGFVDDDPAKTGLSLHGIPVLGTRSSLSFTIERLQVDQVLLAIPSATSEIVRDVATVCEQSRVTLRVLPSVREILHDRVTARDIRDLRIEDLLGRQQVGLDAEVVAGMLRGRRVMITGAGGSIGSEISRQVAAFEPAALILLDHDETHLHDLISELEPAPSVSYALADVRDRDRMLEVFTHHMPNVVFHAAAHKHVPLLETHPEEALATNVLGTANVAEAASAAGAERFVLISTDKAVRPSSVMGASKWFAEQVIRSLHVTGTIFCAVRFGNVLGSRGSVIPLFMRQIRSGGPVTVTDPRMARYFMSIQEAVCLVLQAAAMSEGGEVFTLEMGDPVKIIDLAQRLIRLSGRVPERDIEIELIGARPGEKLVEDALDPRERPAPSHHPGILVSRPPMPDRAALKRALLHLEALKRRPERLRDAMHGLALRDLASEDAEEVVLV